MVAASALLAAALIGRSVTSLTCLRADREFALLGRCGSWLLLGAGKCPFDVRDDRSRKTRREGGGC